MVNSSVANKNDLQAAIIEMKIVISYLTTAIRGG